MQRQTGHPAIRALILMMMLAVAPATTALEAGDSAPDFSLPAVTQQGRPVTLSELSGTVVYVDFWASWCAPCLRSLPLVNELYEQYSDQRFEVVAITVDHDLDAARQFLEDLEEPLAYRLAADVDSEVMDAYGVRGMPTSFLIDRDGIVRYIKEGFREGDIEQLEQTLRPLL